MDILNQPHDKYFRATFGKVSFAADFLNNYLPKDIVNMVDMDTLEPQAESFLDEKLEEQFTDLLFKVDINDKAGYVFFLFEHKSYKDRMVIFQILRYMVEIWLDTIKSEKEKVKGTGFSNAKEIEIPIILPLVVYHDRSKWNMKNTLGEMIPDYDILPESLKKYIPNFEHILLDLSDWEKEDIRLHSEHMIAIKALTRARSASTEEAIQILISAIELINKTEEKDTVTYYVSECIKYMLSIRDDISEKEMERIAGEISKEGGELVMSIAEKLRREGEEKGIELGRIRLAKDMIENSEPLERIMQYTKLSKKEIDIIRLQMDH